MAWTTPRTWVYNEIPTEGMFNEQIRDNEQYLYDALGGTSTVPAGAITMYSGAWNFDGTGLGTGTLLGWALCNGNNGTPNLLNRFIMGTVTSAGLLVTGGSNTHTITTAELAAHTHTGPSHTHTGPPHTHTTDINCYWSISQHAAGTVPAMIEGTNNITSSSSGTGATGASGTGATGSTGSGSAFDSRPAYMQLAFIKKL